MDYIEKQMEALNKKITARISNLEASIIDLKRRQRDDEFVYGVGGAFRRKENAIDKREKEITELKEFLKQIKKPLVAEDIIFSVFYCKECHNGILTEGRISEEWHECSVCQKMIYGRAGKKGWGLYTEDIWIKRVKIELHIVCQGLLEKSKAAYNTLLSIGFVDKAKL